MSFEVVRAGFLSTIQDYGRFGYAGYGMSPCGVMDEHAYCWANYLLDNHFNDSVIEITFGGVTLQAGAKTFISVTGADLDFAINAKSAPLWSVIPVKKGDLLTWKQPKSGIRTYFAVKNGFDTASWFGSRSVNVRENIGYKLMQGDQLPCMVCNGLNRRLMPKNYIPEYNQDIVLRLLPTYQFSELSSRQKHIFFNQVYTISHAHNRTGCRLHGIPMALEKKKMISEGISYGSVEIAGDGLPIILLKDAPTIGGYVKIGTVFSLDLSKLAQKQTNARVRFTLMQMEQAQIERATFNQFFAMN